jgi:hypothetical protein
MKKTWFSGMRYILLAFAFLIFIYSDNAFSQKAKPKAAAQDTKKINATKSTAVNTPNKDSQAQPLTGDKTSPKMDGEKSSKQTMPEKLISDNGFGGALWGDSYKEVKSKIVGEVKEKNDGDFIVSQVGELTMKYGFFRNPLALKKDAPAKESKTAEGTESMKDTGKEKETEKKDEQLALMTVKEKKEKEINERAKLFYVTIRLPYILSDRIEEKLNQRLGKAQGKNIKTNQGVIWWETGENLVLLWVDDVNGTPYSRKIDIIGKKIREEIKLQQRELAKERENKILTDLNF